MKPVAVFYHCLFVIGTPPVRLPSAWNIVYEQMRQIEDSGLLSACSEFHIGVNGSQESIPTGNMTFPKKAQVTYHGLTCRNELRTLLMLHDWAKAHPGWYILYIHSKSATHDAQSSYGHYAGTWRKEMMKDLVTNWRACAQDLDAGYDIVCSHFMWNMGSDQSQHIPAGNFLWITSDFAAKLPSIMQRERIKISGIDSVESRFEAEVFWGNGPRPNVKSIRPNGGNGIP